MADPKQYSEEEADDFMKLVRQKQTGRVSRMEGLGIALKSTPRFYLCSVPMRFTIGEIIRNNFTQEKGRIVHCPPRRPRPETAPAM
jgi:hypothetical protein